MRRKDREVLDDEKIDAIIQKCSCCRLGFIDHEKSYIVPLNFGYENISRKRTFYFHSANSGKKIDLLSENPIVGFELDTNYEVISNELACQYSAYYQSIIGTGKISLIESQNEKEHALQRLMLQATGKTDWTFDEKIVNRTAIFKLEVEELSCKEHSSMGNQA